MCRFNLLFIEGNRSEALMKEQGYSKMQYERKGYHAYAKGMCNCGSFVGSLTERKGMSYEEAIALGKKEKLLRLYQIRSIMKQPNYQKQKEEFQKKQTDYCMELEVFSKPIQEYEMLRTSELEARYNGQELSEHMEILYQEIGKMLKDLDEQPDYALKREEYHRFIEENGLMNQTTCYYLTRQEYEKKFTGSIPLAKLFQDAGIRLEEKNETPEQRIIIMDDVEVEEESFVIDEKITRTEQATDRNNRREYQEYQQLFHQLLCKKQSFFFTTVWSEPKLLKEVKSLTFDSLTIDDLAFLDFDEMILIHP